MPTPSPAAAVAREVANLKNGVALPAHRADPSPTIGFTTWPSLVVTHGPMVSRRLETSQPSSHPSPGVLSIFTDSNEMTCISRRGSWLILIVLVLVI